MKSVLTLVVLLLLQSVQQPVFKSSVNFVELDVSVLDRNRKPVTDLTSADFIVLEDGVPQTVETFESIAVQPPAEAPAVWWASVPADVERNTEKQGGLFVLMLVVERNSLLHRTKEVARDIIARMSPADQMAVANHGFSGQSQDLTSDKTRLLNAVERFRPLVLEGDHTCNVVRSIIDVTKFLSLQGSRRKTIFLVSDSVPSFGSPDAPCYYPLLELFADAQRAHVNIYPINPRGLVALGDVGIGSAGAMDDALSALRSQVSGERTLAENTGGVAITQTNMFAENIERAYVENRAFYVIGYHSTNASTDRKFRRIEVKVAREGVSVRARNGYVPRQVTEDEASPAVPAVVAELSDASRAAIPATSLLLDGTAIPFNTAEGPRVLAIASAHPAARQANSGEDDVQARALLVDRFGSIKQTLERRARGRVTGAGPESAMRVPFVFELSPGRYQVRFAANSAATNATGSVFVDVDVPNVRRDRLAMSGVALHVVPDSAGMEPPPDGKVFPFLPSTRRTFVATDQVNAAVRVYAHRVSDAIETTCRVLDAAGAAILADTHGVPARDAGNADGALVLCRVPIEKLAAGHYLLDIDTRAGKRVASRKVKFIVE